MRRRWCAPKSCRPRCGSNRADRPQHGGRQPKRLCEAAVVGLIRWQTPTALVVRPGKASFAIARKVVVWGVHHLIGSCGPSMLAAPRFRTDGGETGQRRMITRRRMLAATGGLVALAAAPRQRSVVPAKRGKGTMEIKRNGSQPSGKGPADYFTGAVRVDPCSRRPIRHVFVAPASRSSPARARLGTPIRSVRP